MCTAPLNLARLRCLPLYLHKCRLRPTPNSRLAKPAEAGILCELDTDLQDIYFHTIAAVAYFML